METPTPNTPKKNATTAKSTASDQNAIELLKADHREVEKMFEQFSNAKGRQQRKKLIKQIATALTAHTIIEEEIFYPACRENDVEEDDLDQAQVEHDSVKMLVRELLEGSLDDDYYDAKVTVLSEYVKHHVKEEEEPEKGIFARIQKTKADLDELGRELKERKDELMEDEDRLTERPPRIRSFHLGGQASRSGGGSSRHFGGQQEGRDERGRFTSEDDEGSRSGYRGGGRNEWGAVRPPESADRQGYSSGPSERGDYAYGSQRDYDDRGYQGSSDRDWRERGSSEDEEQRGRQRYRSEAGEGHGGWYGDSRDHSEAARRGWRNRDH
ncbi:MAG TPA: hemerythrin domain-containing protein [Acetobacteraceae bacterium]|nr:hemerythrin domain-containing protein [Acetobacteraceae bacterium]